MNMDPLDEDDVEMHAQDERRERVSRAQTGDEQMADISNLTTVNVYVDEAFRPIVNQLRAAIAEIVDMPSLNKRGRLASATIAHRHVQLAEGALWKCVRDIGEEAANVV